jgi:galactokinase
MDKTSSTKGNTRTIQTRSPGRINLIGEHTDYNGGFVLPAAIDKAAYISLRLREDDEVHLTSRDFKDSFQTDLGSLAPSEKGWPNYLMGVTDQLLKRGAPLRGFEVELWGDVPAGAGMSSSAAVECAMLLALNEAFDLGLDRMTMAKTAQEAEHAFAGVKVGIMDPFASLFGKSGHVIRLDCRSLEYTYVPCRTEGYLLVLCDSGVHHSLASSEYNVRRQQCEEGVALVAAKHSGVTTLRDVTMAMLKECVAPVNPLVYRRCKYVVEESERVIGACRDLESGDLKAFGAKLYDTHEGLSHLYEVSCPELDFLVERARTFGHVLGSRMMGGGFGGCTLNLVKVLEIPTWTKEMAITYKSQTGKDLKTYIAEIADGGSVIE